MKTCVYWLFDAGCSCPEKDGYIGITRDLSRRISRHRRSKRFPDFNVKVLFEGSRHECSALEFNLRPKIGIGWNFGTGGKSTHGTLGKKLSDKTRKRMQKAHANRSPELRALFCALAIGNKSRTGQKASAAEREKHRMLMLGNKIAIGNKNAAGRVMPQEQRDEISRRMKGKKIRLGAKLTAEQRANISAGRKGKGLGNQNWRKRKENKDGSKNRGLNWPLYRVIDTE